jgi:hypothetical protein
MALGISDTTPDAAEVYVAAYASLSGADRIERSMEMAEEVKQVTLAGIAHRNPEFTTEQVHREWLRILHGEALASLIS